MVGLILPWSVVHGGPGGNFLSPTLYNSIVYGPGMTNPRLEDVPNPELKGKIEKVRLISHFKAGLADYDHTNAASTAIDILGMPNCH